MDDKILEMKNDDEDKNKESPTVVEGVACPTQPFDPDIINLKLKGDTIEIPGTKGDRLTVLEHEDNYIFLPQFAAIVLPKNQFRHQDLFEIYSVALSRAFVAMMSDLTVARLDPEKIKEIELLEKKLDNDEPFSVN